MEDDDARVGLSDKHVSILNEFRENVKDLLTKPEHDDFYLLRWLRARNFDLKKSEHMLRKSIEWRVRWKADTILTDWTPPDVITKYYPGGKSGYDRDGCPVWIYPCCGLHMKSLSLAVKKSDIIRYNIFQIELIHQDFKLQSAKFGRRIDKATLVCDLEGFTLKLLFMPGMDIIMKFLSMVEANYPETLKSAYVFNGPMVFPILFRMIKPILSEDTKKKIVLVGKDWKERLLAVIDADQLPEYWGGTATDPDGEPHCQSRICIGGEVPEEYFLKGENLVDKDKIIIRTIQKGEKLKVSIDVTAEDQAIKWIFWTKSHDIKYGLAYVKADGTPEEVIPPVRVNCDLVPEDGLHACKKIGTYVMKFDNSYSWINSKQLSYCIELVDMDRIDTDSDSMVSCCSTSSQ